MNTALLDRLEAAGFRCRMAAGNVLVSPSDRLTDDLRREIAAGKRDLLIALRLRAMQVLPRRTVLLDAAGQGQVEAVLRTYDGATGAQQVHPDLGVLSREYPGRTVAAEYQRPSGEWVRWVVASRSVPEPERKETS